MKAVIFLAVMILCAAPCFADSAMKIYVDGVSLNVEMGRQREC